MAAADPQIFSRMVLVTPMGIKPMDGEILDFLAMTILQSAGRRFEGWLQKIPENQRQFLKSTRTSQHQTLSAPCPHLSSGEGYRTRNVGQTACLISHLC